MIRSRKDALEKKILTDFVSVDCVGPISTVQCLTHAWGSFRYHALEQRKKSGCVLNFFYLLYESKAGPIIPYIEMGNFFLNVNTSYGTSVWCC